MTFTSLDSPRLQSNAHLVNCEICHKDRIVRIVYFGERVIRNPDGHAAQVGKRYCANCFRISEYANSARNAYGDPNRKDEHPF